MYTFNQFQKELKDLSIADNDAYIFTLIYERLIETENQLTMCAKLVNELAGSMRNVVELSAHQQKELRLFMRMGRPDGVEVESVINKPEDD